MADLELENSPDIIEAFGEMPKAGVRNLEDAPGVIEDFGEFNKLAGIRALEESQLIGGLPPNVVTHRMRGFDTNLGRPVFWNSLIVDALAADYVSPGDILLSSVRVFKVKGD